MKRIGYVTREMVMQGGIDAVKIINSKTKSKLLKIQAQ